MTNYKEIIINKNSTLVVLLSLKLKLLILEDCPKIFTVNNTTYYDLYDSDWTGFYDWQRDHKRNITGVTHFIHDDECYENFINDVHHSLSNSVNIVVRQGPSIDIYFSDNPQYIEDTSGDQLFGSNRIYKSDSGNYAISFSTDLLTDLELKSLKHHLLLYGV